MQRYLHVVEIVLAGIGLIGLVIAALGITNAMLAAVRERRREIGVLKAIGARDRDVRRIFLLEAATLGFIGGAIGTTAGWLTARALGECRERLPREGRARGRAAGSADDGAHRRRDRRDDPGPGRRHAACPTRGAAPGPPGDGRSLIRGRWARVLAASCVACVALTSCSRSEHPTATRATSTTAPRKAVLVAIGSNSAIGAPTPGLDPLPLTQTWPQLLYREGFPISTVFVNASNFAVSAERAFTTQVPIAIELHATDVAVWLGDRDFSVDDVTSFESWLDLLVRRLRDSGARVLLGNLPRRDATAIKFDGAIERVAKARGAILVDLAAALASTPEVMPSSNDLSAETNRTIADAFIAAVASS